MKSKPGREVSSRQLLLWALPQTSPEPEESPCSKEGRVERGPKRKTHATTSSGIPASISTWNSILWGLPRQHPSSALRWVRGQPGGCKIGPGQEYWWEEEDSWLGNGHLSPGFLSESQGKWVLIWWVLISSQDTLEKFPFGRLRQKTQAKWV